MKKSRGRNILMHNASGPHFGVGVGLQGEGVGGGGSGGLESTGYITR